MDRESWFQFNIHFDMFTEYNPLNSVFGPRIPVYLSVTTIENRKKAQNRFCNIIEKQRLPRTRHSDYMISKNMISLYENQIFYHNIIILTMVVVIINILWPSVSINSDPNHPRLRTCSLICLRIKNEVVKYSIQNANMTS